MSLLIKASSNSTFQPAPVGAHPAVCTRVIDYGRQDDPKYGPRKKLYLGWELPEQRSTWRDKNGQQHSGPMMIGRTYSVSLAPKSSLRKDLESWRGRPLTESELRAFDITLMLGQPCMLVISHRDAGDRTFANITAVASAPKGAAPKASGKLIAYDTDEHDPEVFALLPEWQQKIIDQRLPHAPPASSTAATTGGAPSDAEFNDNIPF
jgi:hypothetical protein